ncbi:hypothetical protein [Peribacillus butanolivorans]|uniref:hypothetical protein n=1 Tax=Peribacillus butanolivorans TaxID=421767 RepID=UPI00167F1E0A|nr:hypothetical protein [Peribacillus butanolivorans]QNU05201.1 hypothetical protein GM240_15585 [Peribacillus butanolivorans]
MKKLLTGLVVLAIALGVSFSTASASAGGFHHPQSWDKNSILRKDSLGVEVRNMQYILNVLVFILIQQWLTLMGFLGRKPKRV